MTTYNPYLQEIEDYLSVHDEYISLFPSLISKIGMGDANDFAFDISMLAEEEQKTVEEYNPDLSEVKTFYEFKLKMENEILRRFFPDEM